MILKGRKNIIRLAAVCFGTIVLTFFASFYPSTLSSSLADQTAFNDLQQSEKAYPYVNYLKIKNLIKGYPDGSFRPDESISRAEISVLLARACDLHRQRPAITTFKDVGPGHWAYDIIEAAAQAGLIKGDLDGFFRPEEPVTRAETSALLLRLIQRPLPAVTLPDFVRDVDSSHWALNQVAASLDAGLLTMAGNNCFEPDVPATRAQVARGLALTLNINPESTEFPLTSILTRVKGEVTLIKPGQEPKKITDETTCGAGSTIKTSPGGKAELRFTDGSGLRLGENTELTIKKAFGQSTILRDGSPGTMVKWLEVDLPRGRIFGALAATYFDRPTAAADSPGEPKNTGDAAPVSAQQTENFPPNEADSETRSPPWWSEAFAERVRVRIDTPWAVANIRGAVWMNEVRDDRQITNSVGGPVDVTSAGQAVAVPAGQTTVITSPAAPPASPVRMPLEEQLMWMESKEWVYERASAIDNAFSVDPMEIILPAPKPVAGEIIQAFIKATSDAAAINSGPSSGSDGGGGNSKTSHIPAEDIAPPVVTSTDPAENSVDVPAENNVTVIFSENIQPGSAYNNIIMKDAAGNTVFMDKSINGQTLTLHPLKEFNSCAPVSGVITVSFDMALCDTANVAVQLNGGGANRTIYGSASNNNLTAPYSDLTYGTFYTVTVPAGSVRSKDYDTYNDEVNWSFITRAAPIN
ncbi:MAG: Cellulosome-anchoring protein precursor [Pelotomaculum sp. PtaU1.Bin035]|nr:MAG: Cellulosome-anchoring protein precursor [Pelotomaculum sp. PtaU1.Bin035]